MSSVEVSEYDLPSGLGRNLLWVDRELDSDSFEIYKELDEVKGRLDNLTSTTGLDDAFRVLTNRTNDIDSKDYQRFERTMNTIQRKYDDTVKHTVMNLLSEGLVESAFHTLDSVEHNSGLSYYVPEGENNYDMDHEVSSAQG